MCKVSVIVPIYNVENYIKKCLDSLVNQTLQEIEIILVNDGSKDKSKEIAKEYAKKYEGKIIYLEKENGGLSDARNYGIPHAKGEYIAFLDSDDYIEENAYEEMYNKAKQEQSDYVECDFIWEYPKKSKIDKCIEYANSKEMLKNVRVVAWNKLIKRTCIVENNIYFPKGLRYEDVEFTYKLIPHLNKCSYVNKPFVHYVQRDESIANNQNERNAEIFTILNNVIKYYKEQNIYEEYEQELEYTYTRLLLCSSLKRMLKIQDKKLRKELLTKTWNNLNESFPSWRKNNILKNSKKPKDIYMKYFIYLIKKVLTKEVILYAIFGLLTTFVNLGLFFLMNTFLNWNENLSNFLAIIMAVLFAYVTNKDLVFHSEAKGAKEKWVEFIKFMVGRAFTMIIEFVGGIILFKLPIPNLIVKIILSIIVIILNFFISKFFAFKKDKN